MKLSNKLSAIKITSDFKTNLNYQSVIISKCENALMELINSRAYENWHSLSNQWSDEFKALGLEVCNLIQSLPQMIHNNEIRSPHHYTSNIDKYEWINHNYHSVSTTDDGNCAFNAVSIALIGNESLVPVLKFASVSIFIHHKDLFISNIIEKVRRRYYFRYEQEPTYICNLKTMY